MREAQFLNRRILVTGASGFIGEHLCRELRNEGAEVHAISRRIQPDGVAGLRWWKGDLGRIETVRDVLAGAKPEVIFHLASFVSGVRDLQAVLLALHDNLITTVNILTVAAEMGCERIVIAGSLEEPELLHAQAVPSSPYAAAKFAASAYARMFSELYRTPVVVARLSMVYGPGQRDLRKLVPYVTLALLRGETPELTSGERPVDWIYIDDVVGGLKALVHAPVPAGSVVDLGCGKLVSVRGVVERLNRLTGAHKELEFGRLPDRPLERACVADVARTRAHMDWQATVSLEDGLERTVAWYRQAVARAFACLVAVLGWYREDVAFLAQI